MEQARVCMSDRQAAGTARPLANQPLQCQCGKSYTKKSSRDRHVKESLGLRPHRCPFCDERFIRPKHLKTHLDKVHKNGRRAAQALVDALLVSLPEVVTTTPAAGASDAFAYPPGPMQNGPMQNGPLIMANGDDVNNAGWPDHALSYNPVAYHGTPVVAEPTAEYAAPPGGFEFGQIAAPNQKGPYDAVNMAHFGSNQPANNYGTGPQDPPGSFRNSEDYGVGRGQDASPMIGLPGFANGSFGINNSVGPQSLVNYAGPVDFSGQSQFGLTNNAFGPGAAGPFNVGGFGNLAPVADFSGGPAGYGFGPGYADFTAAGSLSPQQGAPFGPFAVHNVGAQAGYYAPGQDDFADFDFGGMGDGEYGGMGNDGIFDDHFYE